MYRQHQMSLADTVDRTEQVVMEAEFDPLLHALRERVQIAVATNHLAAEQRKKLRSS